MAPLLPPSLLPGRTPAARKSAKAGARQRASGLPARDALRLSQDLLRHLPSGIIFFDRHGRVEEANPAARAALGLNQPHGRTLAQLFGAAELREADGTGLGTAAAVLSEAYRSQRILQRKVMHYITPSGVGHRLGLTVFPLRSQDPAHPAPPGMICLLTDLTQIHALEEELQRRRNLSSLGEMAAGIAHEFKNALATISGYGQMLHATVPADRRDQVGKILEQAAMLNDVATQFLTFARPLVVQAEAVELGPLLRQCAEAMQVQDFPGVEIQVTGRFPAVAGDAVLLTAALANLLRNACEAITLSGRGQRVEVKFGGWQNRQARILFSDDGPGVDPIVADKIFIPFFTTKPSGTGLGLAMVHKIITAHQGSVLLADAAAGHTVFELLLPGRRPRGARV
ncbi:MAG: two-component system sensor histidine kinase NtrB [Terriglobales bacterium]